MATQSVYLQSFLSDPDKEELVIPIYQRPYSWTSFQIEDLFTDIKYLIDNNDSKHFMGLLVLTSNGNQSKSFDIIDGQQRITSISILLAVIRDKLDDIFTNNFSHLDKKIHQKISGSLSKIDSCLYQNINQPNEKIKLITQNEREFEQEFLNNILLKLGGLDQTDPRLACYNNQPTNEKDTFAVKLAFMNSELGRKFDKRKVKTRRSYRNYIEIEAVIRSSDDFQKYHTSLEGSINFYCDILLKAILEKISVVDFITRDYSEAFKIFEVLNDRGLAISSTDLIKNLCLKQVSQNQRSSVFSLWRQIFDQELSGLDDIQFLRYSSNSRREFITKNELYFNYNEIIKTFDDQNLLSFLENDLLQDAVIFKTLKKEELLNNNISINNVIKLLQSTKSTQWYSVGLSALRAFNFDQSISTVEKIKKILEKTHEIIFNLILTEKKANKLEKFFPLLAFKLNGYITVKELQKKLDETSIELSKFIIEEKMSYKGINLDDVDFQSSNSVANMFLFFIDYKECFNYSLCIKSLEHILPQNPKTSKWPIIMGVSKIKLDNYIYELGNMLLIEKQLNSRLKAESFDVKKSEYINNKVIDPLDSSNPLNYNNLVSFELDSIKLRTKAIFEKYKSII